MRQDGGVLPVEKVLPAIGDALHNAGAAVLVAPPGTGKTTVVPLALMERVPGRVVVAEPRRVAARAAARRMASLLGDRVGGLVGYTVRGDRRVSAATRVEVVTTGVLVRRLQRDPELPGTGVVILDECHERHLDSDLALAFCVDVRATIRPDLRLLATSATADTAALARALGTDEIISADEALHPVEVVWAPPPRPGDAPHGLWVDPRLLGPLGATVRRALAEHDGDVLVFLPGAGEIAAVASRLREVTVLSLHGRQDAASQDAVLRPGTGRRVVLASAVAESSLTVPGVRVVVDAGLSRVPRTDHARGLGTLVTVPVSRSTADQRAGRAGREAGGVVYGCWSPALVDRAPAPPRPEIAVADLTGFALDLACWGDPAGAGLALPDPPPAGAMQVATRTLRVLGAVDAGGRVTARGRAIVAVGAHPRLARALLDGAPAVGADRAAQIVALLTEQTSGEDLVAAWRRVRSSADHHWKTEVRRLRAEAGDWSSTDLPDDLAAGLVVGLAYPERLARARQPGGTAYLMVNGAAADLARGPARGGAAWPAPAAAARDPSRPAARIRVAAAIDEATARVAAADHLAQGQEVAWSGGDVVARTYERLGAVTLVERPLRDPDRDALDRALLEGLRREGLTMLRWDRDARALRERLAFCRHTLGAPWPDVSDDALLDTVEQWLGPELHAARRRADLERADIATALRRLLPWPQAAALDRMAPERLPVPGGSRLRVDYTDPQAPVLALRVQEAFGWREAPVIADGRVPVLLHLLSPARRPVAVTNDLASFWRTGYPQVRAELRGRYPRHAWPENPTTTP
ncbi:ATP-dependent helicase HrpB [Micromonospora sp. CPCC 205371]|nr:ATP-dependent helicase HrpB [Micromonospora sp. CPCC 205371]